MLVISRLGELRNSHWLSSLKKQSEVSPSNSPSYPDTHRVITILDPRGCCIYNV